jgi:hypothetical protein
MKFLLFIILIIFTFFKKFRILFNQIHKYIKQTNNEIKKLPIFIYYFLYNNLQNLVKIIFS